jgi:hypothetical protein
VKTERDVVDEETPIHLTDVDGAAFAGGKRFGGGAHVERNGEGAGEQVHRAERQDTECEPAFGGSCSRSRDRPVAAADHNGVAGFLPANPGNRRDGIAPRADLGANVVAFCPEDFGNVLRCLARIEAAQRAGVAVEDERQVHAGTSTPPDERRS